MCLNCGCGEPNNRHDNEANITLEDVRRAGEANGQSVDESLRNMGMAARQVVMSGQADQGGEMGGQHQNG
jgi:hypothetical protein